MPLWTLPPNESPRHDWNLRRSIEVAAGALFGRGSDDVVQGMVDLFDGRGHRWTHAAGAEEVACAVCGASPVSGWYINLGRVFVATIGGPSAKAPAICQECVLRDWRAWESNVVALVAHLRRGDATERTAAGELEMRFRGRRIRVEVAACERCGVRAEGVRGVAMFACARCLAEAKQVFARAHAIRMQEMDDEKRRAEEAKQRPFSPEDREAARREARRLRERRARMIGPPAPRAVEAGAGAWDEVRGWFRQSPTSYVFMRAYQERVCEGRPPPDVVDTVARGLAVLIESTAQNGLRRRHKGRLEGDDVVVDERWPAQHAMSVLGGPPIDPAVREELDLAIVLLRGVLWSGVRYYEWDDGYDDITDTLARLTLCLYDAWSVLAWALSAGGLLLSGGSAEERLLVAREIHLARTGGLDAYFKTPFVVVGDGPGEVRLDRPMGRATVFVPRPLELAADEQAQLFRRLDPDGPPEPTILGADAAASLCAGVQGRWRDELLLRLYCHEYDVGRRGG